MKEHYISHMIRMEDLNHHQVLYAGRAADWLIESAFVAAVAARGDSAGILFIKMETMEFFKSVRAGDIIKFTAKAVEAGRSSITIEVIATSEISNEEHIQGRVKFVSVDPITKKPVAHGIVI